MSCKLKWNWKRWSLIPTVVVRTRLNHVVISWLCVSLWFYDTAVVNWWSGKYARVGVSYATTRISSPDLEISYQQKYLSIRFSILGFNLFVGLIFSTDEDLPF